MPTTKDTVIELNWQVTDSFKNQFGYTVSGEVYSNFCPNSGKKVFYLNFCGSLFLRIGGFLYFEAIYVKDWFFLLGTNVCDDQKVAEI